MSASGSFVFALALLASAPGEDDGAASVVVDGCTASLEPAPAEPGVLRYRNDCTQPHEKKLAILGELLAKIRPSPPPRALFVGRLVITFPELAARLAASASRSPRWDAERARLDAREAKDVVRRLLGDASITGDLDRVLETARVAVKIGSVEVEKVLIARAESTPIAELLAARRVRSKTPVPFDCVTWFRLEARQATGSPTR